LNRLRIIALPRSEIESRPTRVESEISTDDVRDGFCFDLAFCPFGFIFDIEVEQRMSVLVNQCDREICVVRPSPRLDDWLEVV
jgi:hypothetical protein